MIYQYLYTLGSYTNGATSNNNHEGENNSYHISASAALRASPVLSGKFIH